MSKGKVTLTPQQISDSWNSKMKQAVPRIQAGIDAVTDNPMEKAAAAQDKFLAGVQLAVSQGRFAAGCRSVTTADWKARTRAKVGERLAGGVDAAMPKRQKFDQWLVPTLNSILPGIQSKPDLTFEDKINRMTEYARQMHAQRYKGTAQ